MSWGCANRRRCRHNGGMPHALLYRLVTDSGEEVAHSVRIATSAMGRTKGLMFDAELPKGHGLVLSPCSSIHMFFMRFAIDVAFVDLDGVVVRSVDAIKPWRATSIVWGAKTAIELPAGTLAAHKVVKGSRLELKERAG